MYYSVTYNKMIDMWEYEYKIIRWIFFTHRIYSILESMEYPDIKRIFNKNKKRWKQYNVATDYRDIYLRNDIYEVRDIDEAQFNINLETLWKQALDNINEITGTDKFLIFRDIKKIYADADVPLKGSFTPSKKVRENREVTAMYFLLWFIAVVENIIGPYGILNSLNSFVDLEVYKKALYHLQEMKKFFQSHRIANKIEKIEHDKDVEQVKKDIGVWIYMVNHRYVGFS